MPTPFHHPKTEDLTLDEVLYALSDPTRRNIVAKLVAKPGMNCRKTCLDMAPSTVSFHYKVLRDSGLIRSEKKGVEVINRLRKSDIDHRFPGLLAGILRHHDLIKT